MAECDLPGGECDLLPIGTFSVKDTSFHFFIQAIQKNTNMEHRLMRNPASSPGTLYLLFNQMESF